MLAEIAIGKVLFVIAACGIAYLIVKKSSIRIPNSDHSTVSVIAGIAILLITYYLLFWFIVLTVGRILAPWDQWAMYAPPQNTWQRQLNDFFTQHAHQYLAATFVIGLSAAIFSIGVFKKGVDRIFRISLAFAAINMAFLLTDLVTVLLLSRHPTVAKIGYNYVLPDIIVTSALLVALLGAQSYSVRVLAKNR